MRISGRRSFAAVVLGLALAHGAAAQAQDAVLARKSGLAESPAPGAKQSDTLAAGTALSVLERKGGWYRVRASAGQEGWVRLLSVRLTARSADPGAAGSGDAAGAAFRGAESGGAGGAAAGAIGSMVTGSAADSTAVRGGSSGKLSGQQLVDPASGGGSMEQVESFKPSDAEMDDFEKGLDAPASEEPAP